MQTITQQSILIVKEKDGDYYYVVNNSTELRAVLLELLRERSREGYYASLEALDREKEAFYARTKDTNLAGLTDIQIEELPDNVRDMVKQNRDYARREIERFRREQFKDRWFAEKLENLLAADPADALTMEFQGKRRTHNLIEALFEYQMSGEYQGVEIVRTIPVEVPVATD